jgi:hypothetical protein
MKFVIEIVRDDGEVMTRVTVTGKGRATALLGDYKSRGGAEARISNDKGEKLYKI